MRAVMLRMLSRGVAVTVVCAFLLSNSSARAVPADTFTAVSKDGSITVTVKAGSEELTCIDNTGKKKTVTVKTGLKARGLALTQDGSVAAVIGGRKLVVLRLPPKHAVLSRCDLKSSPNAVAISPKGKRVAFGGSGTQVILKIPASDRSLFQQERRASDEG
jgi:hypothetical protein